MLTRVIVEKIPDNKKTYLGDGVYAIADPSGYGIWLHINNAFSPSDRAYLEPSVMRRLIEFATRLEAIEK